MSAAGGDIPPWVPSKNMPLLSVAVEKGDQAEIKVCSSCDSTDTPYT